MSIPIAFIFWSILALGLASIVLLAVARQSRSVLPPLVLAPGETLPTAPIQRAARWSLVVSLPLMLIAGGVIASEGPTVYQDDDTIRLLVTGLLIASLFTLAAPMLVAGIWSSRGDDKLDERDRAILSRAPAGQAGAMLVVLAVWTIALQESFRGQPGIPHEFLYLIFWSCALVSLLASNVGILMGYMRA
jgi:hypothetical protein